MVLPMAQHMGFWIRLAAYAIDSVIVSAVSMAIVPLALGIGVGIGSGGGDGYTGFLVGYALAYLLVFVGMWLYFALMESSSKQGTLGKMAVGIKVTDINGQRISFWRATGRLFAKILSGLTLGIGYLMIAFTEKKQGLHDMIAGTFVVKK
jgi:uncharacterized RDD family membrane protein YckC